MQNKITIPYIQSLKDSGSKIAMLTAYDYTSAKIADEAGVEIILVGDSLGMVMLGFENTLPVSMEDMLHHTKSVARAKPKALLVADMPFMSYNRIDLKKSLENAAKFISEGNAEAVKLEGGARCAEIIRAITEAQIPVMAHIGLTPQSIHKFGGYKVQGKTIKQMKELLQDAQEVQEAGAFALVLEGIPWQVAKAITESLCIPTIGIGAGPYCDGQVLVFHDLLGLFNGFKPKFVRRYLEGRELFMKAISDYIKDVKSGNFPSLNESYDMPVSVQTEERKVAK